MGESAIALSRWEQRTKDKGRKEKRPPGTTSFFGLHLHSQRRVPAQIIDRGQKHRRCEVRPQLACRTKKKNMISFIEFQDIQSANCTHPNLPLIYSPSAAADTTILHVRHRSLLIFADLVRTVVDNWKAVKQRDTPFRIQLNTITNERQMWYLAKKI